MPIATATAFAAVAAVVANVLVRALAVALFDIPQPEFEELNLRPVILSTLGGVIAAGIVYAVMGGRTRPFVIVAVVALALSLIAPLTIDDPNADAAAVGTLIAMHVVAAAISAPILIRRAHRVSGL